MKPDAEMRCEKCGRVYARVETIGQGHALVWKVSLLPLHRYEQGQGDLHCACGHKTRLKLADFGMR